MASHQEFRAVCGAGCQVSCASSRCNRLPERQVVLRFSIRGAANVQPQPAHPRHCGLFRRTQCTCQVFRKIWRQHAQCRRRPCPSALQLLRPARRRLLPPFASAPKSGPAGSIIPPDLLRPLLSLTRLVSMSFSSAEHFSCENAWTGGVQILPLWFDRYTVATECFRPSRLASSSTRSYGITTVDTGCNFFCELLTIRSGLCVRSFGWVS